MFSGLLKGILEADNNSTLQEQQILINGGANMKYQGITIHKNAYCNTWYARPSINGKQVYIAAKTQQDCYNKLKIAINLKNKQPKQLAAPQFTQSAITLQEWYTKWLKLYKRDVKPGTIKGYKTDLSHVENLKDCALCQITAMQIQEQLNKIKGSRTQQKVYDLLNMLYKRAVQNELVNKNPLSIIDKPKHKKTTGIAMTEEDETKFISFCREKNKDLYLVILFQGLRRGEALALTADDIDFKNKTLTINKALSYKNKIGETKTATSNRSMPLFERTAEILEKYKNVKGRLFKIAYQTAENKYNDIIHKIFEGKKYTIHSLRHTFITKMREADIPLHVLQSWVGHTIGSSVTTAVYTHKRTQNELAAIEKANKLN